MKKKIISENEFSIKTQKFSLTFNKNLTKQIFYLGCNTGILIEQIGSNIYLILINTTNMREGESLLIPEQDNIILFSKKEQLSCQIGDTISTFTGWTVGIRPDQQVVITRSGQTIELRGISPFLKINIDPTIKIIHHSSDQLDERLSQIKDRDNFVFFPKTDYSNRFNQWMDENKPPLETVFYNIEDLPDIQKKITQLIRNFGQYTVLEYSNPIELIDDIYFNRTNPSSNDIIITDNHMPYMTGAALISQIITGDIQPMNENWLFIP